jgi:hypothetical protein
LVTSNPVYYKLVYKIDMKLKFNSGRGAVICDNCSVIILQNFVDYESEALNNLSQTEGNWFCKKCDEQAYKQQQLTLLETINEISEKYQEKQKTYISKIIDKSC